MTDETFGSSYDRLLRQQYGNNRIHVQVERRNPLSLKVGEWVMYLPIEITEGAEMAPRMAQVIGVRVERGVRKVTTTLGIMQFEEGDLVQVCA